MKQGFGLIEVLAAAVVLGFLLIGLNTLQKGNRESIIRIRARDAANVVAQDIIDSISAMGSASVPANKWACKGSDGIIQEATLCRERIFEGLIGTPKVQYSAIVDVKPANSLQMAEYQTEYQQALATSGPNNTPATGYLNLNHQFAKQIDVTVNWRFKNSDQTINISSVIR